MAKGKGRGRGRPRKIPISLLKFGSSVGARTNGKQTIEEHPVTPIPMEQCLLEKDTASKEDGQTRLVTANEVDSLEELSGKPGSEFIEEEEMVEGGEKVGHICAEQQKGEDRAKKKQGMMNEEYLCNAEWERDGSGK
ncbi:hypothetical protein HAX54_050647 [Datura stramonium]|uniref:Uncharacterized protein n=1 Tax=Datura stramonium TaxID=4076 RepID=A0ABS8RQX7_DATST|nr:hypothetical protein [Datura stramonium]